MGGSDDSTPSLALCKYPSLQWLMRRRNGMGIYLSARELAQVDPAVKAFHSPVPTQIVSNGEFNPLPQTPQQQQVEARLKELADMHGAKLGLDRRQFLRTSCGMAAAFVAFNNVFGNLFD